MSSPVSTRLFIEGLDITPDNQVLVFTNATAVGNYYGASSYEYTMAQTYFTGPYALLGDDGVRSRQQQPEAPPYRGQSGQ